MSLLHAQELLLFSYELTLHDASVFFLRAPVCVSAAASCVRFVFDSGLSVAGPAFLLHVCLVAFKNTSPVATSASQICLAVHCVCRTAVARCLSLMWCGCQKLWSVVSLSN